MYSFIKVMYTHGDHQPCGFLYVVTPTYFQLRTISSDLELMVLIQTTLPQCEVIAKTANVHGLPLAFISHKQLHTRSNSKCSNLCCAYGRFDENLTARHVNATAVIGLFRNIDSSYAFSSYSISPQV